MSLSRRGFLDIVGSRGRASGLAALIASRGNEAAMAQAQGAARPAAARAPAHAGGAGPGRRRGGAGAQGGRAARRARLRASTRSRSAATRTRSARASTCSTPSCRASSRSGTYPFNSTPSDVKAGRGLAAVGKASREHRARPDRRRFSRRRAPFTSPYRHLVTASPIFENCTGGPAARTRARGSRSTRVQARPRGMLTVARGKPDLRQQRTTDGDRARREDDQRLRERVRQFRRTRSS